MFEKVFKNKRCDEKGECMNLKQIELERKVLKLMLIKNKTYAYISNKLKENHFSSEENKSIFRFLYKYYQSYGKRSTCKLFLRTKTNSKIFNRYKLIFKKLLTDDVNMRELPYYVKQVIRSYKARNFLVSIYNANKKVDHGNINKAIEYLSGRLIKLQQEGADGIIREGGYLEGVKQRAAELVNKDYYFGNYMGVPTGLRGFDKCYGGVYPGELGIVVGGTGKGKSIMLLNFVVHATKLNLPVVIVTVEMPKQQYEYRLDSRLTQIEANKFRKKELSNSEIKQWIKRMKKFKRSGQIYIIDIPEGANTNIIELKLKEAERYLKTDKYLLVVDYLNLLIPNRNIQGGKNDHQVLGEISENLKQLARKKHIPVWSAAQLNKQGAKQKVLTAEDIGYSYKISADSDFQLGLIQTDEMEEEGVLKVVCMKGRSGKFSAITCYPDFKRMRLNDKDDTNE